MSRDSAKHSENSRELNSSVDVARHILWLAHQRGRTLTPMQLLKLVYISHGWMLALHDRSLFRESVEAWQYGPVEPRVYNTFKKFRGNQITEAVRDQSHRFDKKELDVMRQVVDAYVGYTGIQLSSLTHRKGSPWDIIQSSFGTKAVIPNDLIKQHYLDLLGTRSSRP